MYESGLSGKLWPAHIKPQSDELLSSWLVRLAAAHSLKLHTFCTLAWSRDKQIWNRDIDKCADESMLDLLVEKTGTPRDVVIHTTLAAYQGWLYERHNPYGNTQWIMPVGVYHRTRKHFGLQFCPRCLAEDVEPYYRRSWRLAFVSFCEVHHISLFDRCPKCGAANNFHRNELGHRRKWITESITLCHACQYDLRNASGITVEQISLSRVLDFQKSLTKTIKQGWIDVVGYGAVYSHLYFKVLHQLMKVCATGRGAMALCQAVRSELGIETLKSELQGRERDIERLHIDARRNILDMARYMLDEWPHRFIYLCYSHKVWSTTLLRDFSQAPFWYWSVIHDHLYRISYTPSDQEIHSAIEHLNRRGIPLSKKYISRCLGTNNDVFRKRKSKTLFSYAFNLNRII